MPVFDIVGSKVEVLRKPDPDGFVLCRRVMDGAMRYIELVELTDDGPGELAKALAKAPDWHAPEEGYDPEENLP